MNGTATSPLDNRVASGLNLVLPLRSSAVAGDRRQQLAKLMAYLEERRPATSQALRRLNFVHFARFLPASDGSTLSVITEFDGPLQPYVMDFIIVVGDEFSTILSYMEGWPEQDASGRPSVHVRDCPDKYWDYIRRHNLVQVAGLPPFDNLNLFSAYPQLTMLDIIGPATDPAPGPAPLPKEGKIDLADVQANLLRGVGARRALHLALEVGDPAAARRFVASVTSGDPALPQVSDAQRWDAKAVPDYRMTIGFTHAGLAALGVGNDDLDRLPLAFQEGPSNWTRAAALGDHGASGPQHWVLGAPGQAVHMLVSLYGYAGADAKAALDRQVEALTAALAKDSLRVLHRQEVWVAEDCREHFGYRDGIAQPRIAGLPGSGSAGADVQPEARAGEFLLGADYVDIYGGRSIGNLPQALCTNASYAVVRLLAQDVKAFDKLLADGAQASGKGDDWVAAKLMGRHRDGTPLSAAAAAPGGTTAQPAMTNTFDYAPSQGHPGVVNDHQGLVCPVGAHARRMNPRHARVSGEPHSHRVLRRGMPYGPTRAQDPEFEQERGLYGIFVCADIERQFEFLQRVWANGDIAASGIRGTQDPIIGAQDLTGTDSVGSFRIPTSGGDVTLQVPRLVTTRGSLYLLMPGLAGLRHLAALEPTQAPRPASPLAPPLASVSAWVGGGLKHGSARLNTASFNPKDSAFLANPYPFYAVFLREAPVLPVSFGPYRSLWVFGHHLVDQVCNGKDEQGHLIFHKPAQPARRVHADPRDEPEARGLFYMDPPLHTQARQRLDPAVAKHFADAASIARQHARDQLRSLDLKSGDSVDVIRQYTRPVTRNTLLQGLGIPAALGDRFGDIAEGLLRHFDPMQPLQFQAEQLKFGRMLVLLLVGLGAQCPAQGGAPGLWCDLVAGGVKAGGPALKTRPKDLLESKFPDWDDRTILATAANFVLAGFLSMDFLLGNALALLLDGDSSGMHAYRSADPDGRARMLAEVQRFDPPFQLADRVAAQDTQLGGVAVSAGTLVTVCYGSANHDPDHFKDPDRFDVTRQIDPKHNWIFGHGHHYCIGALVAKEVTQAVLDELVAAHPGLALDPKARPRRMTDAYLRGFASLTLRA